MYARIYAYVRTYMHICAYMKMIVDYSSMARCGSVRDHFGSRMQKKKNIKHIHGSGAVISVHCSASAQFVGFSCEMAGAFEAQQAAMEAAMQADADAHAQD